MASNALYGVLVKRWALPLSTWQQLYAQIGFGILIVMPLSVPGILATSIFSFIGAWNEYVYAATFLNRQDQLTLPVGIQRFFAEFSTDWPGLMAATFLMSVPVVVLFLILQRYFVRALTEGAVKS